MPKPDVAGEDRTAAIMPAMETWLIDTDPGVDDALAILMALAARDVDVVALTVTAGNVGLAHTVRNALKLLEVAERDIPVHPGAAAPLVRTAPDAAFVHGRDGFGDVGYTPPTMQAVDEHAALAIVRLAREHEGRLNLLMLGPLTNLALALKLDPGLPARVRRLVVMGGAVRARGNVERLPVEFNIGFDPEAAHIVFSSWPAFELVDWEATLAHALPFERFEAMLDAGDERARFYRAISRKTADFMRGTPHRGYWVAADALAMAVALRPDGGRARACWPIAIALDSGHARGMTVVDFDHRGGAPAQASVVESFDPTLFDWLIARGLGVPVA
jgi:purine nucleosidase